MKHIMLFVLCILGSEVMGQYNGGDADGQSSAYYAALLSGTGESLFAGGIGDGQSSFYLEARLTIDCISSLTVNGNPIAAGEYQSLEFITSSGEVHSPTEVTFKTGRSIILLPGFKAEPNSIFKAEIDYCISQPVNY